MRTFIVFIIAICGFTLEIKAQDTTSQLESMPEFPGGVSAFMSYIRSSIVYPDSAIDLNQEGTVIAAFEVDTNGKVINAKIVRGIPGAPYLDREALRVISSMPDWTPARQNGKPIKMSMSVPVRFLISVEDDERRKKEIREQKKANKKKDK